MIPNIIHYCWFSGEEMPEVVKHCMASWHKYMPDYEYRLWDMDAVRDIDVPYLKEALECRKWAFAADFIRLFAVEKYGGIYMDADVEVFKSLDEFRSDEMFIGREIGFHVRGNRPWNFLTSHAFGAEAHHPFLQSCLRYYNSRKFILSEDTSLPLEFRYDLRISPEIDAVIAHQEYGYDPFLSSDRLQCCKDGLKIYPSEIFDGAFPSVASACRHLCLGGWRDKSKGDAVDESCETSIPLFGRVIGSPRLKFKFFRIFNRLGYIFMRI